VIFEVGVVVLDAIVLGIDIFIDTFDSFCDLFVVTSFVSCIA